MKNRTITRKSTILPNDTFKELISYKSVFPENDLEARNKLKMEMLSTVINAIGVDKWERMKSETKQSLECLAWLSCERGFVWCSPEYISARYSINSITVRRYVLFLEKQGIISRLWRSSSKHNGRGCMVVFFHSHPYFEKYWGKRFFLSNNAKADVNSNEKAEKMEKADPISKNDRFLVSTVNVPEINKNNYLKDRSKDIELVPDYIDSNFAHQYACYFGLDIKKIDELWKIVKCQAWKINIDPENVAEGAIHALKQTVGQMKIKPIKNVAAYFTATVKGVYERIFHEELDAILDAGSM